MIWAKLITYEKNELRDEKQRLKTEKENLNQRVKAFSSQPGVQCNLHFLHQAKWLAANLCHSVSYPGVSMWQFMPPAAVETSQDHFLRPPVAEFAGFFFQVCLLQHKNAFVYDDEY